MYGFAIFMCCDPVRAGVAEADLRLFRAALVE
jgi:hypothetical protein